MKHLGHAAHFYGDQPGIVEETDQRGTAEQWIKEGQRSHSLHAPLLPPVPGQRGAVTPRGHRPQPRQSPAAARLAARHPELAVDQPPAAAVQDRWSPDPACAVLVLQLAQSHLTARLFGQILARIEGLAWRPT